MLKESLIVFSVLFFNDILSGIMVALNVLCSTIVLKGGRKLLVCREFSSSFCSIESGLSVSSAPSGIGNLKGSVVPLKLICFCFEFSKSFSISSEDIPWENESRGFSIVVKKTSVIPNRALTPAGFDLLGVNRFNLIVSTAIIING